MKDCPAMKGRNRIATLTRELEEARAHGAKWQATADRLLLERDSAEAQLAERTRERDEALRGRSLTNTDLRRIADEFKSERDAAKRDTMRAFDERNVALARAISAERALAERTRERDEARRKKTATIVAAGLECNDLLARAESAERQVEKMREALRFYAIDTFTPHPFVQKMSLCHLCSKEWPHDQPEQHAPGCLAAIDSAIEAEKRG